MEHGLFRGAGIVNHHHHLSAALTVTLLLQEKGLI
jgi:hypothetical protein